MAAFSLHCPGFRRVTFAPYAFPARLRSLRMPDRLVSGAIAALMLIPACRSSRVAETRDWNAWPWMEARIPPQVQLTARVVTADTAPARFQGILTFRNTGRDSTMARFGACSFGLRLYRDPSYSGLPVWDDRPGPNVDCIMMGYEIRLGPAESRDKVVGPMVIERGPLPGRYAAAITWRASRETPIQIVRAGGVVIR